jgi:preprotein translocase subunit SecG
MLIGILLAINIVVCLGLIGVVLLQRSEGGALGMGGGNTGFMTARGAGDLLTRITWILFSVFLFISLVLTILTGRMGGGSAIDRLKIDNLDTKTLNAGHPRGSRRSDAVHRATGRDHRADPADQHAADQPARARPIGAGRAGQIGSRQGQDAGRGARRHGSGARSDGSRASAKPAPVSVPVKSC